jgi:hypothetical protein
MAETEIPIRIDSAAQLFDALDPAPFREKSLSAGAEAYLVDCAGSLITAARIDIVLTGPQHLQHEVPAISEAIHGHFAYLLEQARRRWQWRARIAGRATALGVAILMAAVGVREALGAAGWAVIDVASEGLLIFGWVALWRPIEHLVFDRVEYRARCRLLERLAAATLQYRLPPKVGPLGP